MQTENTREIKLFELLPTGVIRGQKGILLGKRRVLIGSAQSCDVVLRHSSVGPIHAILEMTERGNFIYDMSTSGTFVNNNKVVKDEIKVGDICKFGTMEYEFKNFVQKEVPAPPLEVLASSLPPAITGESVLPPNMDGKGLNTIIESNRRPELPSEAPPVTKNDQNDYIPSVAYPLAKDPNAEFSEYIFEDADNIYPIFDYSKNSQSTEVIILFKDQIHSVDYIVKDGMYKLVGSAPGDNDLEYAYLNKKEKVNFIEIKNGDALVHAPFGHEVFSLTDDNLNTNSSVLTLKHDDIVRFTKGDLSIFVRGTHAPPRVKHAPILRRDSELKKYILLVLLFLISILSALTLFEVDEEVEKEKVPERIATILYKKKLVTSKKIAIDKTKDAPKKVAQKSPKQKEPEKKKLDTKKKEIKKNIRKPVKKAGTKSKKVGLVKKAKANKGPTNKKTTVRPVDSKKAGGAISKNARPSNSIKNPSKGHIDTYKSVDFKSSINSLLAKGGNTKNVKAVSNNSGGVGSPSFSSGGQSATLDRATVKTNVGSLAGAASGTLDSSSGAEGLVNKKSVYTAGLPYRTVILGGMDPDTIRKILIDHLSQFRHCYQKALDTSDAAFDGVVRLDFIIGASGHVTRAGVKSTTNNLPGGVKSCVVNVLKGIKFPEPRGGGVVEVNQPFNFYPNRN